MADQVRERDVLLPLLPIPGGVVMPGMVVTIAVESADAGRAVAAASEADDRLVVVPRVEGTYASIGTIVKVEASDRLRGGGTDRGVQGIVVRGLSRAVIGTGSAGAGGATWVQVTPVDDVTTAEGPDGEVRAELRDLMRDYRAIVEGILQHRGAGQALISAIEEITDPGQLADTAVYSPDLDLARKVEVLETLDVAERLRKVTAWARDALAELEVRSKIRDEVNESMEKRQREFILREQLKAIRSELRDLGGAGTDGGDELDDYRSRTAELPLPDAVRSFVEGEIDRLERTGDQSPEQSWIRTWLDRVLELPWGERTEDTLDVEHARAVLDADHTGLTDVKDRLVEQLAVRRLRVERGVETPGPARDGEGRRGSGAILALVGPPGVGKTSVGESVARAMGRRFVRVALGGVRDEAEIRGHRRTYVGAQPGRIARAMTEAGAMNPVLLLDEIDKVGTDYRGDPSAALLEVLDPAQNHTFRDNYLEVDLDLSDVLFIATANVLDTIPAPLLDRLEVVQLDGYTDDEKVTIARDHLLDRQLTLAGLSADEVEVTDEVLRQVVEGWTREAGVRQLERQLGTLARKAAVRIAGGTPAPVVVDDPADLLGRQRVFREDAAAREGIPGMARGLAVTGAGGDVLVVETARLEAGEGTRMQLTGQLGEVMKESASIALSFLQSHAGELDLPPEALAGRFHVHVPAGAIPKDGPSAGITLTTALASLVSGRPVRPGVGMTGEVTLQGTVLPIGGVKQKVLAAHRAGLSTVILPRRNGPDLEDVPEPVREQLDIQLVDDVREVLRLALAAAEPAPA